MKLKGIISGLIAVTAIGLMATVAHAETYSVTSTVEDAANRLVDLDVVVTPDTGTSTTPGTCNVNGYVIFLEYDPNEATPILKDGKDLTGGDVYAVAGADFNNADSVLVSGIVDSKTTATSQTLAVSWASKDPVTVDTANEILSSVQFKVEKGVSSTDIDLTVGSVTSDGTDLKDSTDPSIKVASGTITLDEETFKYGDANQDGMITSTDVSLAVVWTLNGTGYTDLQKKIVDVNGDDMITSTDVTFIVLKVINGDSYKFPVEQQ